MFLNWGKEPCEFSYFLLVLDQITGFYFLIGHLLLTSSLLEDSVWVPVAAPGSDFCSFSTVFFSTPDLSAFQSYPLSRNQHMFDFRWRVHRVKFQFYISVEMQWGPIMCHGPQMGAICLRTWKVETLKEVWKEIRERSTEMKCAERPRDGWGDGRWTWRKRKGLRDEIDRQIDRQIDERHKFR